MAPSPCLSAQKNGDPVRVLLIEPSQPWVTNSDSLRHLEQVMVPIGLAYLASYLKRELGRRVEVKIVSTLVDLKGPNDMAEVLTQFAPDVVGIRWVIFYTAEVRTLLALSKELAPRALRVVGGPQVTGELGAMLPQDADVLVQGEGELTFCELAHALVMYGQAGLTEHLSAIRGIIYRHNGRLVRNEQREPLDDLDQLPPPDYSLIDFDRYRNFLNFGYNRRPMAGIFTSRGCPYQCIYCHKTFGKRFRGRSARSVHEEIVQLHRDFGVCDFCIVDDNFNADGARLDELTRRLINEGPRVNLYFPNGLRGDCLSLRQIDQLIDAGMIYISFSLETASSRLQTLIRKHVKVDKLSENVEYSCERGVITNMAMMVGFPTETVAEAKTSLEYLARFKKLVLPYYFCVKYYPGTELYERAGEFGVQIDRRGFASPYHGYDFQVTPTLSVKDFEELNRWYLRNIFLNAERIENAVGILHKHFTQSEINEMFSLFFRRPIFDIKADVIDKHCFIREREGTVAEVSDEKRSR